MSNGTLEPFDAVIIGTGQGGKPLATALSRAGWKTAVLERADRVGGTCVLWGCTPSKTMIASARVAHLARRAREYGVKTGGVSVDMMRVRERKREMVEAWRSSAREGIDEQEGLELIMGEARFVGVREMEVSLREGGVRKLVADRVFVDVGTRPAVPPIDGLDGVPFLDSTSIMELGEVPDHLVILGGGFVGLEFAQMFRRFGADVTVLERGARLAPREDEEICTAIREIFEEDGIDVRTDAPATRVEELDGGRVRIHLETGGGAASVTGSHLLVAAGRTPNSDSLSLEATGLATDEGGYIPVNGRRETAVDGIWALGDVTGEAPFTHMSYDDYRVIRENLLEDGDATADGRIPTYVVFVDPELGRVGLTEGQAREKGYDVRVATLPMGRVARAMEMDETRGLMKAVVDAGTDRILGAAVLGVMGGEVMSVIKTAMMGNLPWQSLRDAVYAHPTLSESLNNLFMDVD